MLRLPAISIINKLHSNKCSPTNESPRSSVIDFCLPHCFSGCNYMRYRPKRRKPKTCTTTFTTYHATNKTHGVLIQNLREGEFLDGPSLVVEMNEFFGS